ncbi:MAG: putative selenium-dependent hydroxylase accessory protein YqeC [Acetobacterium sp.]|nr:putative selenium-dependent hydroxylase accessory protein YqeC [Bacillota bacterium]MCG2730994.1 putative selenium-dependent hydroxylase accessory protein YqeC [Acetobacterium sp.]
MNLIENLKINENDVITLTGGGGKTSLMMRLGKELSKKRMNHVLTTTAKICISDLPGAQSIICENINDIIDVLKKDSQQEWIIGKEKVTDQKISGFAEEELVILKNAIKPLIIINEGDGSKRKPYKFYGDYEPMIPQITTKLIHVIGAEVLYKKIDNKTFHRSELYGDTQAIFDEDVLFQALKDFIKNKLDAKLAGDTQRILFINKADGENLENARIMSKIGAPLFDRCLMGSLQEDWIETVK